MTICRCGIREHSSLPRGAPQHKLAGPMGDPVAGSSWCGALQVWYQKILAKFKQNIAEQCQCHNDGIIPRYPTSSRQTTTMRRGP